jgi:hypothetical protein
MAESGASPTSFFRVFDLAFFVPGTLLLGAIIQTNTFTSLNLDFNKEVPTLMEIIRGVSLLVAVYVLGLLSHGATRGFCGAGEGAAAAIVFLGKKLNACAPIARLREDPRVKKWWPRSEDRSQSEAHSPWYSRLERPRREDLVFYFWYMRAVCANTAFALAVVIVLAMAETFDPHRWLAKVLANSGSLGFTTLVVGPFAFAFLAIAFNRSFRRAIA